MPWENWPKGSVLGRLAVHAFVLSPACPVAPVTLHITPYKGSSKALFQNTTLTSPLKGVL